MKDFVLLSKDAMSPMNLIIGKPLEKYITFNNQRHVLADNSTLHFSNEVISQKKYFQTEAASLEYTFDSPLELSEDNTEGKMPTVFIETEKIAVLSSMLDSEDFESGISGNAENYFRKCLQENSVSTLNGLLKLFLSNFTLDSIKNHRVVGLLHIISHMEYEEVWPQGQTMAISALNHKNKQVAEFAIKCFENWGHPDGVEILNSINFATSWLREYAEEVVREIGEGG